MSSFRERLKEELLFKGWIIKELSDKSGINKRTLDSYIDSREVKPSADQAVKIAKALGVTVEYLVAGKDSHKENLISPKERELLRIFSILDAQDQQTVLNMVQSMSERYANSGETKSSPSRAG